ncbi:MAG: polyphosphate polymerase domain-containing protein, partial [Bacteroidales bacterium]
KKALKNYKILEINNERIHLYKNQYFDTSDFEMYLNHHNGKRNRYKIRCRNYDVSDVAFLEIKFKTNKDRTIKKRINNNCSTNLNRISSEFIETNSPYKYDELIPKLKNNFHRITLAHKHDKERITLDFNLSYTCDFAGIKKQHDLPNLAICEVKREGFSNTSEFMTILRSEDIRQSRMSKYCIGAALLNSDLKKNQFKAKLRYIESLHNSEH